MYDIIGDIHGHSSRLEALLRHMGYEQDRHGWRHPERQAIFVGDFIDRGPEQVETYRLVRSIIERGAALAVIGQSRVQRRRLQNAAPGEARRVPATAH